MITIHHDDDTVDCTIHLPVDYNEEDQTRTDGIACKNTSSDPLSSAVPAGTTMLEARHQKLQKGRIELLIQDTSRFLESSIISS